jgi:hypothetical protein
MPVLSDTRIPFGCCDIFIDGVKMGIQADKATLKIEPVLKEIKIEDFGDSPYDKRIAGYKVSFEAVMGSENAENLRYGLLAKEISGADGKTAYTDLPIGTSLRGLGKLLRIHPRELPDSNKDYDVNIFKAIPATKYERPYGNDQSKLKIELEALPKDGFDASKEENFFRIGDPALSPSTPTIASLSKTSIATSALPTVVVVTGTNINSGSVVVATKSAVDTVCRTLYDSPTQLTFILPSGLTAGSFSVVVKNGSVVSDGTALTLT